MPLGSPSPRKRAKDDALRLKRHFGGHQTDRAEDVELKGVKTGDLLRAAAGRFDAPITVDLSHGGFF